MAKQKKVTPISTLRAQYGRPETQYYDTGIFLLNDIWNGGLPTGKIIELHSAEGLGKTTITLQMIRYLIAKHNLKVAFLDVEGALDESLRRNLGVLEYENDSETAPSFLYLCPYTYDEVSKAMNILTRGEYDIIIYDSIANTSLDIDESEEADFKISKKLGQHALLQGELLKMFKGRLARLGKTLIIINQMRSNINTNPMVKGPELKPAGGKVLDHNFDVRTAITRKGWLFNDDGVRIGAQLRLTTIKNKLTFPYRQVELELVFGRGINKVTTMFEVLKNKDVMKQKGAFFYFPEKETGLQGRERALDYIRENYQSLLAFIDDSSYQVNIEGKRIEEGGDIKAGVDEETIKAYELAAGTANVATADDNSVKEGSENGAETEA
jgi:recombination protein RecA